MTRIIIIAILIPCLLISAAKHGESHYQGRAAAILGGVTEHVLPDKTRVDILTDDVAFEVDFARKWAEGIGQALHYSTMTKRDAGLILILSGPKDERYVQRVQHIMTRKSLRLVLYTWHNGVLTRR